jgi:hypothetical protein
MALPSFGFLAIILLPDATTLFALSACLAAFAAVFF